MKKSLLALAVLGAFAGAASAQTNVTLYGIADVGVTSYDNDVTSGKTTRMTSGNQSASRIGFRGTEDLGSGLKANFVLENGFDVSDGTGGSGFSRLAYVGLQGRLGAVALGKQVSPVKDAHDKIDPFGGAGNIGNIENMFYGAGTVGMVAATGDTSGRPANTIKYNSPNFGGFNGSVAYTFGEVAGSTSTGRAVAANVGYANGPLTVQFAASDVEGSGAVAPATVVTPTSDNQTLFLGAAYNFGVVKLHAAYADFDSDALPGGALAREGRSGLVGVTVPFGASAFIASYARHDVRGPAAIAGADADRIALLYTYDMSKRTNLYAGASYTKNDAGSTLNAGSGSGTVATTSGNDPKQFTVGVRHRF